MKLGAQLRISVKENDQALLNYVGFCKSILHLLLILLPLNQNTMKVYRRLGWFFGILGCSSGVMFLMLMLVVYNNMQNFKKMPVHENYDGILIAFLFLSWFSFIISCYSIVKYKKQASIFRGIGLLGFPGLLVCLILPSKNKPVPAPVVAAPLPDPEETILVEPIKLRTVDGKIVNIKMKADKPVSVEIEGESHTATSQTAPVHDAPHAAAPHNEHKPAASGHADTAHGHH
jgi:hypothetical protein